MSEDIKVGDLLKLFEEACERNAWGVYTSIELQSDGSGCIVDFDDDTIFCFENIEELVERLR